MLKINKLKKIKENIKAKIFIYVLIIILYLR